MNLPSFPPRPALRSFRPAPRTRCSRALLPAAAVALGLLTGCASGPKMASGRQPYSAAASKQDPFLDQKQSVAQKETLGSPAANPAAAARQSTAGSQDYAATRTPSAAGYGGQNYGGQPAGVQNPPAATNGYAANGYAPNDSSQQGGANPYGQSINAGGVQTAAYAQPAYPTVQAGYQQPPQTAAAQAAFGNAPAFQNTPAYPSVQAGYQQAAGPAAAQDYPPEFALTGTQQTSWPAGTSPATTPQQVAYAPAATQAAPYPASMTNPATAAYPQASALQPTAQQQTAQQFMGTATAPAASSISPPAAGSWPPAFSTTAAYPTTTTSTADEFLPPLR